MKTSAGLWIDHREAVIVFVSAEGETVKVIPSNVEKHQGRVNGLHPAGSSDPLPVSADDRQQNSFTGHLNVYYDEIIAALRGVKSILIFGPGEARGELKRRIEKSKSNESVVEIEAADKMSDRQISAKVRTHFPASND